MITKIPVKIIKIENEGSHLIIEGKINKNKSSLIIDTGASKSVFNRKISGTAKDGTRNPCKDDLHTATLFSDDIPSECGIINELQLGTLHNYNYEVTFMDIEYINKLYQDTVGKKIDGLIGNDLLIAHQAIIDYANKTLTLAY